jgi:hypothetical protein
MHQWSIRKFTGALQGQLEQNVEASISGNEVADFQAKTNGI